MTLNPRLLLETSEIFSCVFGGTRGYKTIELLDFSLFVGFLSAVKFKLLLDDTARF